MAERDLHARRWWILATMVVSLLVVVLDTTIVTVALTQIQQGLRATQGELEWVVDAYPLVFAGLLVTGGVLGDRFGRRRTLLLGLTTVGVASALSAFATTPDQLIAGRALMGIGGAAVLPSTLAVLGDVFAPAERGRAIAIWAGATGVALALGPVTGGLLLAHLWWGSVFLVNVPVALFALVAVARIVPESTDPLPARLDPVGVGLSLVGLVAVVSGIIQGGQGSGWGSAPVLGPLLGGTLVLACFGWWERRTDHPALDVSLLRSPVFSAACAATTLGFFALSGAAFSVSLYLQYARGFTPLQAGVTLLPLAVALITCAPRSAALVKVYGAKRVCGGGLLTVAVSVGGYQRVGVHTPLVVVLLLLLLQGAGLAHVVAPATEAMRATLPRDRVGAGSSVNTALRQVGGALGVAVLGAVLTSSYRAHVAGVAAQLPPALRGAASESVGGALAVAQRLPGATGAPLAEAARAGFVQALHLASTVSALVALCGALVVLRYLPGRPGPVAAELVTPAEPRSSVR